MSCSPHHQVRTSSPSPRTGCAMRLLAVSEQQVPASKVGAGEPGSPVPPNWWCMEHRFPWVSPSRAQHSLNRKRALGTETQEEPSGSAESRGIGTPNTQGMGCPQSLHSPFLHSVSPEGVRAGEAGLGVREESCVRPQGVPPPVGGRAPATSPSLTGVSAPALHETAVVTSGTSPGAWLPPPPPPEHLGRPCLAPRPGPGLLK